MQIDEMRGLECVPMDPSVPASARELVLIGGCASVMLLAAANYLANHAAGRPPPRSAYTVTVVLVCGTLTPAVALAAMIRSGLVESGVSSLEWVELLAALLLGFLLLSLFLRKQPDHQRRRVPMLVAASSLPVWRKSSSLPGSFRAWQRMGWWPFSLPRWRLGLRCLPPASRSPSTT